MFLSAVALEVLSGILFFNTIGLVKTESDFIVTLVETDLGRWMLVVPVVSADAYSFLAFPDLICHFEGTEIGIFWLHCATR